MAAIILRFCSPAARLLRVPWCPKQCGADPGCSSPLNTGLWFCRRCEHMWNEEREQGFPPDLPTDQTNASRKGSPR